MEKQFDNSLEERYLAGEEDVFSQIYKKYSEGIYYMAIQYFAGQSGMDAEDIANDIVQETFITIHQKHTTMQSAEAFLIWIRRIAYYKCKERLRKERNLLNKIEEDTTFTIEERIDHRKKMLSEQIHDKYIYETIIECLNDFSCEERTLFYLRYYEELTLRELAELVEKPLTSVKYSLDKTKEKLVAKLNMKGIRKEHCLGIVVAPNLLAFYQEWNNSLSFSSSDTILMGIEKGIQEKKGVEQKKTKSKQTSKTKDITLVAVGLSAVVACGLGVHYMKQQTIEPSAFESITYNTKLTNKPIDLDIKLTNDNFDSLRMNGEEVKSIDFNGIYELTLHKDNKIIDQRVLEIDNIDRDIPKVTNKEWKEKTVYFTVTDESGIDYDFIALKENGNPIEKENYQVNKDTGVISVSQNFYGERILEVPDKAGNILEIKIEFLQQ